MWQLYQFPLCPFSRKVRLLLGEKGITYDLMTEYPWEARAGFRDINPAGSTPAMQDAANELTLADSSAICEYFEETEPRHQLFAGSAAQRAEIRRLVALFDGKFYREVGAPLLQEKMIKRLFYRQPPDASYLRSAMRAANEHMEMLGTLLDHHRWLTGTTLTMADLAAVRLGVERIISPSSAIRAVSATRKAAGSATCSITSIAVTRSKRPSGSAKPASAMSPWR